MRVRWTVPAATDLETIRNYLQDNFPDRMQSTLRKVYQSVQLLKTFPERGRKGRRSGTRELVLSPLPYIVAYQIANGAVEILNVWHDA